MCLAIYKPKNKVIPRRYLEEGFKDNPDGAGFAVSHAGKIIIRKGFFTFKQFYKHYKLWKHHAAVIHFRWCTHGGVSQINCHPFRVGDGMALVHNGVLPVGSTDTVSDTRVFVKDCMDPFAKTGDLLLPETKELVEEFIGLSNKLVLLLPSGDSIIYNEYQGIWDNGIWYSNNSYIPRKAYTGGFAGGWGANGYSSKYGYWDKKSQKWIPYTTSHGSGTECSYPSYDSWKKDDQKDWDNRGYTHESYGLAKDDKSYDMAGNEEDTTPVNYDDGLGTSAAKHFDDYSDARRWERFDEYESEKEWQEAEDQYLRLNPRDHIDPKEPDDEDADWSETEESCSLAYDNEYEYADDLVDSEPNDLEGELPAEESAEMLAAKKLELEELGYINEWYQEAKREKVRDAAKQREATNALTVTIDKAKANRPIGYHV